METKINMHIFWYVCWNFLWQGTIACWIFSPEKKKFTSQHKYSVLVDISLKHSHLVWASVLFSKFCCDVYAFQKKVSFLLLLSPVSGVWSRALHPRIHSLPLLIFCPMPCYRCKQRITIIGLQTYSNILIEGILLKMLRNKRELYLEQAIWFYFVWPVHFALLTQTHIHLRAEQENFWT